MVTCGELIHDPQKLTQIMPAYTLEL